MLLAAAGQTAPYTYESSATRKINSNNNNNNVSNVSAGTSTPTTAATAASGSSAALAIARPTTTSSIASNAASALMKTLSVRLHRGTEFIKDTVQKALVMSATTPVKPLESNQSLKRKLTGAGGIMGSSSSLLSSSSSRQLVINQPYVVPTAAFLRHFTVAPTALHRSASVRKRNPSTDSLLMDLCLFKPIRPMPITPIKINKARGFELKRPKFMPFSACLYSDAEEDDDEEDEEEEEDEAAKEYAIKQRELSYKPKPSTLTLPQHANVSAFVPHEANISCGTQTHAKTNEKSNIHTSGSSTVADSGTGQPQPKPKVTATKRRRRAPLLTAKRRRKSSAPSTKEAQTSAAATAALTNTPATGAPKRKRRNAIGTAASSTSISPMRHSPPMTRQRARRQISASSN